MAQNETIEAWVERFKADTDNQYVTEPHVPRAAGVLRLIGSGAAERGFEIPSPHDADLVEQYGDDVRWAHIVFKVEDVIYFLRVQELCAPNAPRRDPAMVGKAARGPRWLAERAREFVGTGLLQVAIRSDGDDSCRRTAKDTTTSSLEEKIPSVLNEFVAALDRRRKQRKQREEWEGVKERARQRYDFDRMMALIDRQAEQYQAMAKRREFLSALERAMDRYTGADRDEVGQRIAMLRRRIEAEDPGLHPELLDVTVPDPTDEQLEPYMEGWSAEGPYRVPAWTVHERARRPEQMGPGRSDGYDGGYGSSSCYAGQYGSGSADCWQPGY